MMDSVQDQAIHTVMARLNLTANDVNRYIADAVIEYDPLKSEITALRVDIEAGRLVRYPCRVGDTVWTLSRTEPEIAVESERVDGIIDTGNGPVACRDYDFDGLGAIQGCYDSPKPYYLTRDEAEAACAALGREETR